MRAVEMLKLPIDAVRVFSGAKSFQANAVLGSRRLNKLGLHTARVRASERMADMRRKRLRDTVSADVRDQYAAKGYVRIDDFLPPDVFDGVRREIEDDFERYDMVQGGTITRRAMIDARDLRSRPNLRAARSDPRMPAIIRYVAGIGGAPLMTLQTVLARPSSDADPQTMLHSDTFHSTAKAWLFLHDVGSDDGPFAYVPGSHRMTKERYEWERDLALAARRNPNRYTARGSLRIAEDYLGTLGYGAPERIVVRGNTLIVADTHGFHARAPSDRPTVRIELYGSLRRNPFTPFNGLHVAALPPVEAQTNRLIVHALAARKVLGGGTSPWLPRGSGPVREWPAT